MNTEEITELITTEGLARLDAALADIEAHPEKHDQDAWISRWGPGCGTTACIAGRLALLAGGVPVWNYRVGAVTSIVRLPDGTVRVISVFAAELLGVEPDGEIAKSLFYDASGLTELRTVRNWLAETLAASQEGSSLA